MNRIEKWIEIEKYTYLFNEFQMETITLTFGDCGENHVGMQKIGSLAPKGLGHEDLRKIQKKCSGELIELILENHEHEKAEILIVRNGIDLLLEKYAWESDDLFAEQQSLEWDKKAFMYGRVVNKKARHNICFADVAQEPDYNAKKGRVESFDNVPITQTLKNEIESLISVQKLICEGNRYYDINKCYIGFHGDAERRIVVGCRLGETIPLHYQWYLKGEAIGDLFTFDLHHGDFYIMSSKAVGFDWKTRNVCTLRHSAGQKHLVVK